mmetsp:Transcript_4186/g.13769  ORF Transcript_4186/g.13769 Transcript_4186/m.13769 type:complete len:155 (+) Transcript_4186:50-514(+)
MHEEPEHDLEVREQDRFLPVANIARIMKRVLPPNEKIAKDAKEAVQECVSEFICFVTSEASDRCQTEKRKTINGDDLVWAMGTLGFDDYVEPLKDYLHKYRQAAKGDKASADTKHLAAHDDIIPDFDHDHKHHQQQRPRSPLRDERTTLNFAAF